MSKVFPYRRCGNTTRRADQHIQTLFTEGWVTIIDHYPDRVKDELLFEIVRSRLVYEHNWSPQCTGFNKKDLTITISDNRWLVNKRIKRSYYSFQIFKWFFRIAINKY